MYKVDKPLIIAKTGKTTDELMTAIKEQNLQGKFDIVSLLIGVNNQYRGRDAEEYRAQFVELLNTAVDYTDSIGQVFVVSIPDWGVTPFALSKKAGAYYINITDISRDADKDSTLLAEDGLHPSGKMYTKWVERILPVAEEILTKSK